MALVDASVSSYTDVLVPSICSTVAAKNGWPVWGCSQRLAVRSCQIGKLQSRTATCQCLIIQAVPLQLFLATEFWGVVAAIVYLERLCKTLLQSAVSNTNGTRCGAFSPCWCRFQCWLFFSSVWFQAPGFVSLVRLVKRPQVSRRLGSGRVSHSWSTLTFCFFWPFRHPWPPALSFWLGAPWGPQSSRFVIFLVCDGSVRFSVSFRFVRIRPFLSAKPVIYLQSKMALQNYFEHRGTAPKSSQGMTHCLTGKNIDNL